MRAFPTLAAAMVVLAPPVTAQQPAPREQPTLRATQPVPSREGQPAPPRGQQPSASPAPRDPQPVPARPPGTEADRRAKEKVQQEADERDRRREARMRRVLRSICSRC